jgi:release factor glutamine methyltransferase
MAAACSAAERFAIIDVLRAAGCVFAEDEANLLIAEAQTASQRSDWVERRRAGVPLEYLVGWAEFAGLRVALAPGVFVPRRRTEFLVGQAERQVRQRIASIDVAPIVLDLCCGSGALGLALAVACGPLELYAVDIDPVAVRCARTNLSRAGVAAQVFRGDLYAPLPPALAGRVDVLLANAPYVPSDQIELLPSEARAHEPIVALDGGADGLDILRRVIAGARSWLAESGVLLVESSTAQAPQLQQELAANGLSSEVIRDIEGDGDAATVVVGARLREWHGE